MTLRELEKTFSDPAQRNRIASLVIGPVAHQLLCRSFEVDVAAKLRGLFGVSVHLCIEQDAVLPEEWRARDEHEEPVATGFVIDTYDNETALQLAAERMPRCSGWEVRPSGLVRGYDEITHQYWYMFADQSGGRGAVPVAHEFVEAGKTIEDQEIEHYILSRMMEVKYGQQRSDWTGGTAALGVHAERP